MTPGLPYHVPPGGGRAQRGNTEGGIFEARVSPGSFLYLYIFLHLFHTVGFFLHGGRARGGLGSF